jgi:hypothetical protein
MNSPEVIGHVIVKLETFTVRPRTERWFTLLRGSEGAENIGHIRVRTLWCPSTDEVREPQG